MKYISKIIDLSKKPIQPVLIALVIMMATVYSIEADYQEKKYVNGHEIITIGTHEYIIERGAFGADQLVHYEDCNNPIHCNETINNNIK